MNRKNEPFITTKYHLEVPIHEYYSGYCVYLVKVGTKFYINKGKALLQSAQHLATSIERGIRLKNLSKGDMYFNFVEYVSKNRVTKGRVIVLGGEGLSEFELLKLEQETLDKYKGDDNCLNDSFVSYVPQWMNEVEVQRFLQWKGISKDDLYRRTAHPRDTENNFTIAFHNESDKKKRGVYKLYFGQDKYYVGRAKLLSIRMSIHRKEIIKRVLGFKEVIENDFLKKVIEEVNSQKLKVATCYLLKECNSVDDLINSEQIELDKAKDDPNCLNMGFVAKRVWGEADDTVEDSLKKPRMRFNSDGKKIFYTPKFKK